MYDVGVVVEPGCEYDVGVVVESGCECMMWVLL